ncbi:threonine ammonia-lyase [Flaviflagellibacter deserti]|uniref:Threonine/serine dehydratase n=1 Tax=Flaviflagellibacter deserti TaxID=2267266 RepID=A0ABV9Z0B8_9HYPH
MTTDSSLAIGISDVEAAAARIKGHAVHTPLLNNARLDERLGAKVFLKAENLQHIGAFKFRGAYNTLAALDPDVRARGVVAWSSGNHAQAVAYAAALFGTKAVIVMPADAPQAKIENTKRLGAEVRLYDRWTESREGIGLAIAEERGCVVVPPYDHPHVIAGQGTTGLEMIEQAAELSTTFDDVLVPASGGGLVAGVSTAFAGKSPGTKVWGVEPQDFNDTGRSFESGRLETVDPDARSICDALLTQTPGKLTFPINRRNLAGMLAVTDDEALTAVAFTFNALKLVVEPGGSVGLAALLAGKLDVAGKTVGVVLSGGNIDAPMLARALDQNR